MIFLIKKILKKPYNFIWDSKKKIRNVLIPTVRILLYHRVALAKNDPHQLCVAPENFRRQIRYLKENFKIIPLVKMVQDIRSGKLQNQSIAITFDDGYADNFYNALPVLEEFQVPATIFLTAGYINQNKLFDWDQNTLPEDQGRPMTPDEVKSLSNSHLIEIGGHTISHPRLAKIPENEQFKEISGGKQMIERTLNIPVLLGFAYPFGGKDSFNKKTIDLVSKAGYYYACANIHERVTNNSDIYALPRFIIRNWDIEEFKNNFHKFL